MVLFFKQITLMVTIYYNNTNVNLLERARSLSIWTRNVPLDCSGPVMRIKHRGLFSSRDRGSRPIDPMTDPSMIARGLKDYTH